jgi:hypothetical protein
MDGYRDSERDIKLFLIKSVAEIKMFVNKS